MKYIVTTNVDTDEEEIFIFSEIEKAKESCTKHNGEFVVGTVGSLVTGISCKVDGIRYRIGRTSFELLEARK